MFLSLLGGGHFCELGAGTFVSRFVNDFGPENDFPYWKPFLLAGTKREPIKQSLREKTKRWGQLRYFADGQKSGCGRTEPETAATATVNRHCE